MEQLYNSMIAMAQNVLTQQEKAPVKNAEREEGTSFRDLLTRKQGTEACESAETEAAAPQNETAQAEPAVKQEVDLEEQLLAAAISAMQVPIVPVEQVTAAEGPTPTVLRSVDQVMVQAQTQNTVNQEIPMQEMDQSAVAPALEKGAIQPIQNSQAFEETAMNTKLMDQGTSAALQSLDETGKVTVEEAGGEMPVFRDVKDVLVKVGETSAAHSEAVSDTQLTAQVGEQVSQALEQGETRLTIRLNPEHLGQVDVELTLTQNGTLQVELRADNQLTQRLLEKESGGLQQLLMRNTQQDVQIQVNRQQESQQQAFEDGRQGGHHQNPQQERRQEQRNANDFLQQLRLGLIPLDAEAS